MSIEKLVIILYKNLTLSQVYFEAIKNKLEYIIEENLNTYYNKHDNLDITG